MSEKATEGQPDGTPGAQAGGGSAGTAIERRVAAGTEALQQRLRGMPGRQRWVMLGSFAALLAIAGGMLYLAFRPDMRILLSGLEARDAQQIEQELTAAAIPYDVTPDGTTIRVPANSLNAARVEVASKGLPSSGRMGFEIFDKPNWVGSEFDERVNYQRALEGELEHTIESIGAIEQARVNLVMPHDSLFTDAQRDAKASVVLKLRRHLSDEEVSSIRNLVAAAVDTLKPAQVVLVDANGRQQFGPKSALAEQSQYEQALESKLIATLAPVAGEDNVRASVTADFDSGSEDDLDVQYDPNNVATLSMQTAQTTSAASPPPPAGVPGTATNAPNVKAPLYPQQAPRAQSTKQENGTYAVTQHTRHHIQGPGRIHRVTAAILINDRRIVSADGKHITWQPRSAAELAELQQLAQAAVGFDSTRGDRVTVQNLSFAENSSPAPAGLASRWMMRAGSNTAIVRDAVLLLVFFLVLIFIVRPVLSQMKTLTSSVHMLPASSVPQLGSPVTEFHSLDQTGELSLERQQARAQFLYDHVAEYVRKEPAHSTRLLQSWVRTPGS